MTTFHVPTARLATILRLSARRVQQLVTLGILPKPTKSGHDVLMAVPMYLGYLERPGESRTLSEARKKKVEIETKIKTLELRRREDELVERCSVEKVQFAEGRRIQSGLNNLAPRLAATLAAESDQAQCYAIIEKEVRQILEELSDETHS